MNVIVTGVAKGLGLAIAKILLLDGYKVIGIGRKHSDETMNMVNDKSLPFSFYEFDLEDIEEIKALTSSITKQHGRIYGLVNNAAVGYDGVLATMHESQISSLLKINVESPILLTKYVLRSMLVNGKGRVINIGSIIGGTGFNGLSVYGASKAALEGFTRSLAREVGKANITVNTVAPGYMSTQMTSSLQGDKLQSIIRRSPLGALATVDDVASLVTYLLSDKAKMITGATFKVDGGSTA
ncbi:SDR family oxidoreductase [Aeromonas piscicola]|uniref:SDR family NAD(P)-dependent oxidoreductase n=1 Tax=Aeromonas piscicola TaxID=600645 RepID=UPI0028EA6F4E|nr:SDR family oxidoreductase [Aeromonas piscicola]